jgi:hypothetical protein
MDPVPKAHSNNRGADLVNNNSWKFHGCDGGAVAQSGTVTVGAAQAVVDVDPVITDTESGQAVALGGEILLFC